jgi:prophage maintenance system killer protein
MLDLHINPYLEADLDRWIKEFGDDPFKGPKMLGAVDVLHAHYLIVDYFLNVGDGIGGVGPRDANLLGSTLGRQKSGFGDFTKWNNELDICATLFWGLIKNHVFHDGNKRTAFLSLLYHLWIIGRVPEASQKDFETLALRVANNSLFEYVAYKDFKKKLDPEVHFIAYFLKRNTRKIDRRNYMITYRELSAILQRFDFAMRNPEKNAIDIVKIENVKKIFREPEIVEKRIGSLSFPGWTREVGKSEIDKVRKLTKLTPENGIDSEVFFRGAFPLSALIDRYKNLLERLADR